MVDFVKAARSPKADKFFSRLGFGTIIFVFGGLSAWSIFAPIDGAVIAPGLVTVESNRKSIQHLEGGVVSEILVREGQLVSKNDVLIRLDSKIASANLALIDGQLTELYARRVRLIAERDNLNSIPPPEGLIEVLANNKFKEKLAGQSELFNARRNTRQTQVSLLSEGVVQQEKRIAGLTSKIESLESQKTLIEDELQGVSKLYDQGYAPKTRMRALQRESQRIRGESGALTANIAEAQSIIFETQLEIERTIEAIREEAITELREIEVAIAELEERRITAYDALDRTELRAPQSGRVLALSVHTIGGVIAPGKAVMEIVPEGDRLQVDARVTPQDIDKVSIGQETIIRFTGLSGRTTPQVKGVVKTVSADRLQDEVTGLPFYRVVIDFSEEADLAKIAGGVTLSPGMPADSFIKTGTSPAIDYLIKPLTDAMARSMRED